MEPIKIVDLVAADRLRDSLSGPPSRVGPGCVLCPTIDPLRFLAGCRRRRLNQGLVVALGFSHC